MMRFVSAVLPCEWKVSRLDLERKCQYHPHRDLGANKGCWEKETGTMKGRQIIFIILNDSFKFLVAILFINVND